MSKSPNHPIQEKDISIDECLSPHSEIATKLRSFFNQIEQEPLPDKYLDLLNKLDKAEQQQNKNK